MVRSGFSESPQRFLFSARSLIPLLAAGLLFGVSDLHSLLHHGLVAEAGSHAGHDPEPVHIDHGSVDVPCPACLFGLKNQSRPSEAPGAISRPEPRGRLAAAKFSSGVAELSYCLPLGRAPPLS